MPGVASLVRGVSRSCVVEAESHVMAVRVWGRRTGGDAGQTGQACCDEVTELWGSQNSLEVTASNTASHNFKVAKRADITCSHHKKEMVIM